MAMALTWCKCQATKKSYSVLALLWEALWPLKHLEMGGGTPAPVDYICRAEFVESSASSSPWDSLSSLSLIAENSVMPLTYCKTALKLIHLVICPFL